jgi:hypothetical protein
LLGGVCLRAPLLPTVRLSAKLRQIETEAAPIRYVPELIGAGTDPEKTGRCCDPSAIAVTTAASAKR